MSAQTLVHFLAAFFIIAILAAKLVLFLSSSWASRAACHLIKTMDIWCLLQRAIQERSYCLQTTVLSEINVKFCNLYTEYVVIIKKHFHHILLKIKLTEWNKIHIHWVFKSCHLMHHHLTVLWLLMGLFERGWGLNRGFIVYKYSLGSAIRGWEVVVSGGWWGSCMQGCQK